MKITKGQLRRIIREEASRVLTEQDSGELEKEAEAALHRNAESEAPENPYDTYSTNKADDVYAGFLKRLSDSTRFAKLKMKRANNEDADALSSIIFAAGQAWIALELDDQQTWDNKVDYIVGRLKHLK
jgi:hypothetical protein